MQPDHYSVTCFYFNFKKIRLKNTDILHAIHLYNICLLACFTDSIKKLNL
jgi:hypothetical protein